MRILNSLVSGLIEQINLFLHYLFYLNELKVSSLSLILSLGADEGFEILKLHRNLLFEFRARWYQIRIATKTSHGKIRL